MKTKILYTILIILIVLSLVVVSIVATNKNNGLNNDGDVSTDKDIIYKLKNDSWVYTKSTFYNTNNESSEAIINDFIINIYDTDLKICFGDICLDSEYTFNNGILTIDSIDGFKGKNKVSFENENLVLEHYFDDGSRTIYYFETAKG